MQKHTLLFAVLLALIAPAAAEAASKPGARTGGAANITFSTATLNGRVDPNQADTTYFFQIGTTSLFGSNTAVTPAGSGANPRAVSVPVGGLAPATRYHYRLVAQNRFGIRRGARRTFRTRPQPLGVTLAANPSPIAPGGSTTLAGQLTGTNNANRDVVLQSNPFPYTQGFLNASNAQVTGSDGQLLVPGALDAGDDPVPGRAGAQPPTRRARSSSSARRCRSRRSRARSTATATASPCASAAACGHRTTAGA